MECAAAAVEYTEIACPYHVNSPVKLRNLVPDLVLSDLPPELTIDNKVSLETYWVERLKILNYIYKPLV